MNIYFISLKNLSQNELASLVYQNKTFSQHYDYLKFLQYIHGDNVGIALWKNKSSNLTLGTFGVRNIYLNQFISGPYYGYAEIAISGLELISKYFIDISKYKILAGGFDDVESKYNLNLKSIRKQCILKVDQNYTKKFNKTISKNLRKKTDIYISEDYDLKKIYKLYLISMKRFSTPPLGLKFFEGLKKFQNKNLKIFTSYKLNGDVLGALITLVVNNGRSLYLLHTLEVDEAKNYHSADFLHNEAIMYSLRAGIEEIIFGFGDYDGQLFYKKKWGCDVYPYYEYSSEKVKSIQYGRSSYPFLKIIPFFLLRYLGPRLRKFLIL